MGREEVFRCEPPPDFPFEWPDELVEADESLKRWWGGFWEAYWAVYDFEGRCRNLFEEETDG